jgi:xanthine dehydrogenase accessory factor
MLDAITFAARNAAEGKNVALVTVTETSGSSPASVGQMIAVLADGSSAGTVGGGASEYHLIQKALEAIKNRQRVFKFSFDHSEYGMICGGGMAGFGNVLGGGPNLCVFGGGHIVQALARLALESGFSVTVVEDRPEFAMNFESARYVLCEPKEYKEKDPASGSDYAVICTRGHKTDGEALRYCLTKNFDYLGMIGSEKKVTELFNNLRAEGVEQAALDRVYAPIGLDIADALPAEIAVAILAEILLVKNKGNLRHKKHIL